MSQESVSSGDPPRWGVKSQKSKIKVFEAGHPVHDENGLRGTEEIIKLLKSADENTLSSRKLMNSLSRDRPERMSWIYR